MLLHQQQLFQLQLIETIDSDARSMKSAEDSLRVRLSEAVAPILL
jgi:hypothetical protein